jgi:hypothetical protein
MTRSPLAALSGAAMLLAACGAKTLALPEQPVDRAATCGVVAAAGGRLATDIKAALPLETHGRIVHYALLAASAGGTFSPEAAGTVSRRMSELQERVTGGKWQNLAPLCQAAYPAAEKIDVALPESGAEAQLQCNELADFLVTALQSQETSYGNEIGAYRKLRIKLNDAIAPALRARAGSNLEAQQKERRTALAAAAGLGTPTAVMARCIERFG